MEIRTQYLLMARPKKSRELHQHPKHAVPSQQLYHRDAGRSLEEFYRDHRQLYQRRSSAYHGAQGWLWGAV